MSSFSCRELDAVECWKSLCWQFFQMHVLIMALALETRLVLETSSVLSFTSCLLFWFWRLVFLSSLIFSTHHKPVQFCDLTGCDQFWENIGQLVISFHHQHKVLTWLWLQNPHGMSDHLWIFANKVLVPSRFLSSFQMKLRWRWRLSRHIMQGWWLKVCRGLYWWCSRILLPLLGSSSVRCQASIILKCFGCSSLCTFFVCRMVYDSDWQDYHFWELALAELLLEIHILMLHTTFSGELSYDS